MVTADLFAAFCSGATCRGSLWVPELSSVVSLVSSRIFHPRDGNPFVLAWFGVVTMIWILGFWWLFARSGAEFLIEHPGLLRGLPRSATAIRIYYCLCIVGGVCGLVFLFVADILRFPE